MDFTVALILCNCLHCVLTGNVFSKEVKANSIGVRVPT